MELDHFLNVVMPIYYIIYFGVCMALNSLLYYLIRTKTVKPMSMMKPFLYAANLMNFSVGTAAWFVQPRIITNQHSMGLISLGISKNLGPRFCFNFYVILLTLTCFSGFLNLHTLYYRLISSKYYLGSFRAKLKLALFSLHYAVPIAVVILSFYPSQNFEAVYDETLRMHPFLDFETNFRFGGFLHHPFMAFNTILMAASSIYVSIVGFFLRWESLSVLDKNLRKYSDRNISHYRSLIYGLLFQILIPVCCYVPAALFYTFYKFFGHQLVIAQYFIPAFIVLPAILDPILSIYFIIPYRSALQKMCIFKKSNESDS